LRRFSAIFDCHFRLPFSPASAQAENGSRKWQSKMAVENGNRNILTLKYYLFQPFQPLQALCGYAVSLGRNPAAQQQRSCQQKMEESWKMDLVL